MFTARFRKYWNDFISEYVEIRTNSINEILEYAFDTPTAKAVGFLLHPQQRLTSYTVSTS